MSMIDDIIIDNFLEHHGVKGMKWGVRKDSSSASAGSESGLGPMLAIYGGIAITALVFRGHQSGAFHSVTTRGKAFFLRKKDGLPWKVKPDLTKKMSTDELMTNVVNQINPGRGSGTKANCRRCTFAYEMRRRGFDVAATKTSTAHGGTTEILYKATHPHANQKQSESFAQFVKTSSWGRNRSTPDHIFSDLAKQPNGARGDLTMSWSIGGAHSVAWEVVNKKPVIIDAQSRRMYKSVKDFENSPLNTKYINDMAFTRLDNIPLNTSNLTRWLKDA